MYVRIPSIVPLSKYSSIIPALYKLHASICLSTSLNAADYE